MSCSLYARQGKGREKERSGKGSRKTSGKCVKGVASIRSLLIAYWHGKARATICRQEKHCTQLHVGKGNVLHTGSGGQKAVKYFYFVQEKYLYIS